MRRIIQLCCLVALLGVCSPLISGAEGDPAPRPDGDRATGERGERGDWRNRSPEEWAEMRKQREWKRLVEEKPELAKVDPDSPEGQAALTAAREQRMQEHGERIRGHIAERQTQQHEELRVALGFEPEIFEAVVPLLARVETLQMQRSLTSLSQNPMARMMPRGRGRGDRGDRGPERMAEMLLGDTELDPTVSECRDAAEALKSLVEDPQASEEEIAVAVRRLRTATAAYEETLDLAQEDLRSVLTPRQEAVLLNQGILD